MSIEDEARAEAHRRYPIFESDDLPLPRAIVDRALTERRAFLVGAEWALRRASRREPTPEEVEAAAKALAGRFGEPPYLPWSEWGEGTRDEFRRDAYAALMAALSARNTRETNG